MAGFRLPGGGIATGPDSINQHVIVKGRKVYFDYDRRFGPLLTDKEGEPLKRQPGDHSEFWGPFYKWLAAWNEQNPPPPPPPPAPSEHWDNRRVVPFRAQQRED